MFLKLWTSPYKKVCFYLKQTSTDFRIRFITLKMCNLLLVSVYIDRYGCNTAVDQKLVNTSGTKLWYIQCVKLYQIYAKSYIYFLQVSFSVLLKDKIKKKKKKNKAVFKPRVSPAFAITYFCNNCNIRFDPIPVKVICAIYPRIIMSKSHKLKVIDL